jgi:UDP-N-acetyl-2-amino-2-deoxyglucuronate dehydrogenase
VLTYITSRGNWYDVSWKGQSDKSGGIPTNVGIHFFDMLIWMFGSVIGTSVHLNDARRMAGFIELERARVRWFLSVDARDLPAGLAPEKSTYRSITIDGSEIELSEGFTDLHTRVYERTLAGKGWGIAEARPSIELVHELRKAALSPAGNDGHPMLRK